MELKQIRDNLLLVGEVVGGWETDDDVSEIELDIVLSKLRDAYELLKYGALADNETETERENAIQPEAQEQSASASEAETSFTFSGIEINVDSPLAEPSLSDERSAEEDKVLSEVAEPEKDKEFVPAPEEEYETIPEVILQRRTFSQNVIRSLYDDDLQEEKTVIQSIVETEEAKITETQSAGESPSRETVTATQVVGEVINNRTQVFGETMAKNSGDPESRKSLRRMVGINDKFMLTRDLFNGDTDEYNRVMAILDEFGDIDDAMLYIHDNFDWNSSSEGAKLMSDLLVRKLM